MKISPYHPFARFSHQTLLCAGLLMTILGSVSAFFLKGRFDGILDLHFVEFIEFQEPFLDNLLNICVSSILLFVLGKFLNGKTRFIDILNAVMVSRFVLYLLLLFNINGFINRISELAMSNLPEIQFDLNMLLLFAFGAFSLVVLIVYLYLMFLGFKVATNSKKKIHILYFIITILLAEFIIKLIYFLTNF